jgi:hypothetical protein
VAEVPRWAGVLLTCAVAGALASALLMETAVGRQALVDQWERTAIAFGHDVDDAEYARLETLSAHGPAYATGTALLGGPGLTLVAAVVLFVAYGRRGGVRFRQVLAVSAHAGVILALRQVVAAPLAYIGETTASATSLGTFVPSLDETSAAARFLGALDLFVVWWIVVLAIGVAVLCQRQARHLTLAFMAVYGVLALVLAVIMRVAGS